MPVTGIATVIKNDGGPQNQAGLSHFRDSSDRTHRRWPGLPPGRLSYGTHSGGVLGEQGQVEVSQQQICLGAQGKRVGAGQFYDALS